MWKTTLGIESQVVLIFLLNVWEIGSADQSNNETALIWKPGVLGRFSYRLELQTFRIFPNGYTGYEWLERVNCVIKLSQSGLDKKVRPVVR